MGKREIDTKNWSRKSSFEWFSTFQDPTFELTVRMDVSEVVRFSKETKTSFFINFLYIVTRTLNEHECTRIRYEDGHVYVYDSCNPTYTVATKCGEFENCMHEYSSDYNVFYERAKKVIDAAKMEDEVNPGFNSETEFNQYYITCLPNLDFTAVEHPIPSGNMESLSVPRVCWGKFVPENGRMMVSFNIVVSHMLVDGIPAGRVINSIQDYALRAYEILK